MLNRQPSIARLFFFLVASEFSFEFVKGLNPAPYLWLDGKRHRCVFSFGSVF